MSVVFVDCETTGLDPERHEIWELAIIADGNEHSWFLSPNLTKADPMGLRVGRYYERAPNLPEADPMADYVSRSPGWSEPRGVAHNVAHLLDGRHLVGAVPSFDAAFLAPWLRSHGQAATWHYHLIDVEALAVGYLYGQKSPMTGILPWNSDSVSRGVGVNPDDFDRHTALGDARWAKAIYEAVTGS